MLPPELLARGSFRTAVTSGAVISFVFYGLVFMLSVYFQLRDALGAGLALAPMTVVLVGVNAGAGWFDAHLGGRWTITVGMALWELDASRRRWSRARRRSRRCCRHCCSSA